MRFISIPETKGYTISLVHQVQEGEVVTYFRTNIPRKIWDHKESDILKQWVLDFINPKGRELSPPVFEENTNNVAFRFPQLPQDNLLNLPQI